MYNYNYNYQTGYAYGPYYYNIPNFYQNTYDLVNNGNFRITYPYFNNNIYQSPTKYLKTLIINSPNNIQSPNSNINNYIQRTPSPSSVRKSLINEFNQVKIVSKSPEPYIKYNTNNDNYFNSNPKIDYNKQNTKINYNINQINDIQNINIPYHLPLNLNLEQNQIKSKTPEPNLRHRQKLKKKKSKNKKKFITKTFINDNSNYPSPDLNNHISNITPNNYYQINNYPTKYIINQINPNIGYKENDIQNNNNYIHRRNRFKQYYTYQNEPNSNFNSSEFIIINSIGEGSFGKIYCVNWIKNNKLYAMKKLELQSLEELKEFQNKVKIVKDLVEKTNHYGFVKIYGDKFVTLYNYKILYYIIMELGERDWEKEIKIRFLNKQYYTENELFQIIYQLVKTLSLMQKNKVSHRDIKPQNILIMKNGIYKICDFGEARVIEGNGLVIQRVRGSQLFMSPILFYAYNRNISQVIHNTYKSDVFSLGMCILLAAGLSAYYLCDIRELVDINAISSIIRNKLKNRYSQNLINLIINMLQLDENLRMDFIELELYLISFYKNQ